MADEYAYAQGKNQKVKIGAEKDEKEHQDRLAAEKYNPALRSQEKSAAEVKASGGLGALAAKQAEMRRRKQAMLREK